MQMLKQSKVCRVGHLVQIPLLDGRFAYALYVMKSGWGGNIIWVFDQIKDKPISSIEEIEPKFLFAPTQTFLGSAMSSGVWQSLGKYHHTIEIPHPTFRHGSPQTGWRLWSGGEWSFSETLPEGGEKMEYDGIWSPDLVEKRIRLGIVEPVTVGPNSPLNV
jgi:Immunity protein 26